MGSEKFCLRWNDFEKNISTAFRELRDDKDFFDVTLACDDRDQLLAHKVILSACSPFFRGVLRRNPHAHPLLYLKGVKYTDLQSVLNFMYHGEVNVAQDELNSFLAVAEDLRVKGLTQNDQQSESGGGAVHNSKSAAGSVPKSPSSSGGGGTKSTARSDHRDLISAQPAAKRPRTSLPSSNSAVISNIAHRPPPPAVIPPPPDDDNEEDDDDIKEVVPVKSEPRESSSGGGGVVANTADMYSGSGQSSTSHALAAEDDDMYGGPDESYDDYEQYGDGSYGDGSGAMMDPSQMGSGADGNKGRRLTMEKHIIRVEPDTANGLPQYQCGVCGKAGVRKDNIFNHLENRHFPGNYLCLVCQKEYRSLNTLQVHTSRVHSGGGGGGDISRRLGARSPL